jgi:pimeloyl-ACP methyl ester carboxylesterase
MWEAFAQRGIASLAWDKPGVGESSGDWRFQTALDRAQESLAAIQFLRQRPEIDASRIGFWGSSQAGWIMPMAYALSPGSVAFIIANSVAIDGEKQEAFRVAHQLPADGYSQRDAEQALAFTELRFEFGHRDMSYESYAKLQKLVEDQPWMNEVFGMGRQEYEGFKHSLQPDPHHKRVVEYLEQIACPMLIVFGERDTLVDIHESISVYTAALRKAGNRDVTIKVFAEADHCLFSSQTGGLKEMRRMWEATVKSFALGYLDTLAEWVHDRFG